jgi:hypothetical protein
MRSVASRGRCIRGLAGCGWFVCGLLILGAILTRSSFAAEPVSAPIDIGSRVEMFVDDFLVASAKDVSLRINPPTKREVVLTTDQPWEAKTSAYYSVLRDEQGKIRLYYRGIADDNGGPEQFTCCAVSDDGIHFTRPDFGVVEFKGSKSNNIVWRGPESASFAPFIDKSPAAKPDERWKAVCYTVWKRQGTVMGLASPDGIHWHKLRDEPLMPPGAFDSLNVAWWDAGLKKYRMFSRYYYDGTWTGPRAIQMATSDDFLNWSKPEHARYVPEGTPIEHFYTSSAIPCPGAEHHLLAFPKRFIPDRKKVATHPEGGVSDAVFMTSRDGVTWDRRFREAWVRPGLDIKNWTERNNMTAWGIIQTTPEEFSLYISEHYRWPDNRLRRMTIPRHRFASMHASVPGGQFVTKPIRFSGTKLILNYSTSAAGSVRVELQDEGGKPIPGFTLDDYPVLYGDSLDEAATWKGGADLTSLKDRAVRVRFVMEDADLYAMRFGDK